MSSDTENKPLPDAERLDALFQKKNELLQEGKLQEAEEVSAEIEDLGKKIGNSIQQGAAEKEAATQRFESPELLLDIHAELSKKHLQDDAAKLTTFIICASAYLSPDELHKSEAAKGSRSVGKDNLFKTCLSHFPADDWIFLTSATEATMQDDVARYRIIAYSEVNLGKKDDKGANASIVETLKQMTEGGTSAMKKDVATGYKTTKHIKQQQKCVLYGTTEASDDDELATRFIVTAVSASEDKIRAVNKNTLNWFAGERPKIEQQSWIAQGIAELQQDAEIVLPICKLLPESMFDCSDSRSMRDTKRLLACASAIAWLHQKQRKRDEQGRIIGEPYDLLAAILIAGRFFNYTYQGLGDQRLQAFMDAVEAECSETGSEVFLRRAIQKRLGLTLNPIKKLSKGVSDLCLVGFHHREGNDVWLQRYQKGVNKVLIGVSWQELLRHLEGIKGITISQSAVSVLHKLEKIVNTAPKGSSPQKNDTLSVIPSEEAVHDVEINPEFANLLSPTQGVFDAINNKTHKTNPACEGAGYDKLNPADFIKPVPVEDVEPVKPQVCLRCHKKPARKDGLVCESCYQGMPSTPQEEAVK